MHRPKVRSLVAFGWEAAEDAEGVNETEVAHVLERTFT